VILITREEIEDQEAERLAPYAMLSRNSLGRVHPEKEHSYRTCYQRDRDRIIHTTAFRRLEHKTQVFLTTEGDYYRTRLTHTVEVAQIGRTIARALRVNEDLTEAICLAHDLGHGPFGHSGEAALNELMVDHSGFDHNFQSFRIVEKIEQRFPDFRGLNLSWEVREGILKHETEYDQSYVSTLEPGWRPTLEAQIVNLADEIAYNTADLDDGLRSGMITPLQLENVEIWRIVLSELSIDPARGLKDMDRHRIIRRLVGKEVTDVITATQTQIDSHQIKRPVDIREASDNIITYSLEAEQLNRQLKDFLYHNLYRHSRVIRMHIKARRIIHELFQAYIETPEILPANVWVDIPARGLHRTVCDYVAGMTDRFAVQEHERLYNSTAQV
jgi:dGTPase